MLPYSAEALFALYGQYNLAIWPIQILFLVLALVGLVLVARPVPRSGWMIGVILALAWVWTGIAFHLQHFGSINFAAPLFAALFVLQAVLLLWGLKPTGTSTVEAPSRPPAVAAVTIALVALMLVPALDWLAGHSWPQWRLFGVAPEPTVLFTLAILLLVRTRWLPLLLVIPAGWLVISGWSGWLLGVWQDVVIAMVGLASLLLWSRRVLRLSLLGIAVAVFPYGSVSATEGGGSVYPYGLNTVATGVLPPPGNYLYLYNLYVTADRVVDGAGNAAVPDFQLDVRAHTLRYLGVLDAQVLGGRPAWLLAQPFIDGDLEVGSFGDGRSGLGDTTTGIMLGWRRPEWHSIAGLDLTLPTGAYSRDRAFNPGRNHFAGTFYYAVTRPLGERYDANLRVNLTLNAKNPDTQYRSGVESGGDYSLNRRFGERWLGGLNGYFQYQLTDDKLDGETVGEDGRRLRVFAIGPQVGYRGDGWGIVGKWQRETGARYKAEGDKYWLQFFWRL